MTRVQVQVAIEAAEDELDEIKEEQEKRLNARGFLDRYELMDYKARMDHIRARIFHLKGELAKQTKSS